MGFERDWGTCTNQCTVVSVNSVVREAKNEGSHERSETCYCLYSRPFTKTSIWCWCTFRVSTDESSPSLSSPLLFNFYSRFSSLFFSFGTEMKNGDTGDVAGDSFGNLSFQLNECLNPANQFLFMRCQN